MDDQTSHEHCTASNFGQLDQLKERKSQNADEIFTRLREAIRRRQFDCVKVLVESDGADVNAKNKYGVTPLHFAAKYATEDDIESQYEHYTKDEFVAYLIKKGAKLEEKDQNGLTPLHYAAVRDNIRVVKQLMRAGAQIELRDNEGMTPLMMGVIKNSVSVCNYLIDSNVNYKCLDKYGNNVLHYATYFDPVGILPEMCVRIRNRMGNRGLQDLTKLCNHKGETALHWAASRGNQSACHLLIDYGSNVQAKTAQGETALHLIARATGCFVIKLLLDHGVDINSRDALLQTPLFKAIQGGNTSEVELLLERGATVNCSDNLRQTPLILAAKMGNADICAQLLRKRADAFALDADNKDALFWAVMGNHLSVVKTLKESEQGKDLPVDDNILHVAARVGSLEITDYLIEMGCGLWGANASEQTPIHVAAMFGHYKVLLRMLEQSPSVALELDEDGNLPVHLAAKHGYPQVLKKLLEEPRIVNVKNMVGWTPLMFAAANNQVDCVKLLLDEGADVDAMDKAKVTPLFVACQKGFSVVVQQLLEHGANPDHRVSDTHALYPEWNAKDVAVHKQHKHCVRLIERCVQAKSTLNNVMETDRGSVVNPLRQMPEATGEAIDGSGIENRLNAMQKQITAIVKLLETVADKVNVGSELISQEPHGEETGIDFS